MGGERFNTARNARIGYMYLGLARALRGYLQPAINRDAKIEFLYTSFSLRNVTNRSPPLARALLSFNLHANLCGCISFTPILHLLASLKFLYFTQASTAFRNSMPRVYKIDVVWKELAFVHINIKTDSKICIICSESFCLQSALFALFRETLYLFGRNKKTVSKAANRIYIIRSHRACATIELLNETVASANEKLFSRVYKYKEVGAAYVRCKN